MCFQLYFMINQKSKKSAMKTLCMELFTAIFTNTTSTNYCSVKRKMGVLRNTRKFGWCKYSQTNGSWQGLPVAMILADRQLEPQEKQEWVQWMGFGVVVLGTVAQASAEYVGLCSTHHWASVLRVRLQPDVLNWSCHLLENYFPPIPDQVDLRGRPCRCSTCHLQWHPWPPKSV